MIEGPNCTIVQLGLVNDPQNTKDISSSTGILWKHWTTEDTWYLGIDVNYFGLGDIVSKAVARVCPIVLRIVPTESEPFDLEVMVVRSAESSKSEPFKLVIEIRERGSRQLWYVAEAASKAIIYNRPQRYVPPPVVEVPQQTEAEVLAKLFGDERLTGEDNLTDKFFRREKE